MTDRQFLYISDVHIDNKIRAEIGPYYHEEEVRDFLDGFCSGMLTGINKEVPVAAVLVAGDIAETPEMTSMFFVALRKVVSAPSFYVLGNHEYWLNGTALYENEPDEVAELYRKNSPLPSILLQNDAVIRYDENDIRILRYEQLSKLSPNDFPDVRYIVYGGTGFSANNGKHNANSRMYDLTLTDRKIEKRQGKKFLSGLHRLCRAFPNTPIIVVAHMPVEDWIDEEMAKKPNIYITGHTHKNERYVTPDGTWVLADNQRYQSLHPRLKSFTFEGLEKEYREAIAE